MNGKTVMARPLRHYTLLESGDFDEFNAAISSRLTRHRVIPSKRSNGPLGGRVAGVQIAPQVTLTFASYGTEVLAESDCCEALIIGMPRNDALSVTVNGRECVKDQSKTEIVSRNAAFCYRVPSSGDMALRIKPEAVEECASSLLGQQVTETIWFEPVLSLQTSFGMAFAAQMNLILDSLENSVQAPVNPLWSSDFQEVLLTQLLLSQHSSLSGRLSRPPPSAGRRLVEMTETVIRARLSEPLRIGQIADELGVSLRSLYRAFAHERNYSPRQFLDRVRLEEVRTCLSNAEPWDTVSTIALRHGFSHLGRFSASYANRFGELPSATLARTHSRH